METRTKESRRKVHSLILLIAFTAILLIVSTYAWFTTQKDVTISNLRGVVEVAESLEISLDGAKWGHEIDLADAATSLTAETGGTITTGSYNGNKNHVPTELLPISSPGVATSDGKNLVMYRAQYSGNKITKVIAADETKTAATDEAYAGYYAFDIFLRNLTKDDGTTRVSDTLQLNSNSYAWVLPTGTTIKDKDDNDHSGDETAGLQNTLRIAFARYGDGASTGSYIPATATQDTIITDTKTITKVAIWEPNADMHVDSVVGSVKPLIDASDDSIWGTTAKGSDWPNYYLDATPFTTRVLKKFETIPASTSIDVYDWSSTNADANFVTPQTVQTKSYYAAGKMPYIADGAVNLKDTAGADFTLAKDSVTKVRVYVWMEGQDPDNTVLSSKGGGIEVQIGLCKSLTEGNTEKRDADIAARAGS